MTTESTSGCEFAQLVTYHVLRDVHGDKLVAVVYGDRLAHEIGGDHTGPRPRLDHRLFTTLVLSDHSRFQLGFDVWSFF